MADINVGLRQVNVSVDKVTSVGTGPGRVNIEDVEPGRTALIREGKAPIAVGQILILDADGDPDIISKDENDSRDNGWDVKAIGGVHEKEHVATFVLGKMDDKADKTGDSHVPFEAIRVGGNTPGSAERTHFNVAHFRYTDGLRGQAYFRRWSRSETGVRHESDWFGPILIGSQA